jgi:NTP pyrophosphatase (non-canonical NTP hydrolase)
MLEREEYTALPEVGCVVTLNALRDLCHYRSVIAGWWDPLGSPQAKNETAVKLALIHSEVSEALEGFRKNLKDTHLTDRPMAEVELADVLIRVFDLAGRHGFDLGGAFVEKLEYNRTRADHQAGARAASDGKKF